MKCYIIFLSFVSLGHGVSADAEWLLKTPRNDLEENLLSFFNMWLNGDPNLLLPLPPLNEVAIPALEETYKESGIKITYSTSNLKLTGLPQSSIPELVATVSETSLTARVVIIAPSLTLFAEQYKLDGRAFFVYPIEGAGEMRMNFKNCSLAVDINLGRNENRMWVETLEFGVDVDKIKINLTGTSSLVKTTLNSKALSIFARYRDDMQATLTELVVPLLNSYLADISPERLLETLYSLRRRRSE